MSKSESPESSTSNALRESPRPDREWLSRLEDDQRSRWGRGERVLVEAYLGASPRLRDEPDAVVDLIYSEFLLRVKEGETPSVGEYLQRFPDLAGLIRDQFEVHAALASGKLVESVTRDEKTEKGLGDPPVARGDPPTLSNLLFGILALRLGFISREALIAALRAWVRGKAKPLGQILLDREALYPGTHAVLERLVQKHLELHGHDAAHSLASVGAPGFVRARTAEELEAWTRFHQAAEALPADDREVFELIWYHALARSRQNWRPSS